MIATRESTMARNTKGRGVALPAGTKRADGLVLGTKSKADRVDRAERKRAEMYALMEAHPESAEVLLGRAAEAAKIARIAGDPLNITAHSKPSKDPKPSALPKLTAVKVHSPTVAGATETLKRVVDTIEALYVRKNLAEDKDRDLRAVNNERAYRAAKRLRNAYDTVQGSIGGSMDFDRVRGGGSLGAPPALHYREAADVLIDAKAQLLAVEHRVLILVVCEGHSIEDTAGRVRKSTERAAKEEMGHVLRSGLSALAKYWFEPGDVKRKVVRPYHAPDVDPRAFRYSAESGTIKVGGTASATRNRVQRN